MQCENVCSVKTEKKGQKNMIKRKWKHLLVYMLILLFSLTG